MKVAPQKTTKELIPEGNHRVILYAFFHPGQMKSREDWLPSDKFVFTFEAVDLEEKDFGNGKPERQVISRTVHGRKYFEFLEDLADRPIKKAEREEGFDVASLIGKGYLVQVSHVEKPDGKRFANLRKVRSPLDDCGKPKNPVSCFSIYWNPDTEKAFQSYHELQESKVFQALKDWQKEEVKKSETFQGFSDFES